MQSGATRRQNAGSRQLAAAKASSSIGRRSGGPRRPRRLLGAERREDAPRGEGAAAAAVGVVGDRRAPAGGRAGAGAAGPEDEGAQRDGREGLAHGAGVERRVCGRGAADGAAQEGEPPRGGHARACGQTPQTRKLAKKDSYAGADPALPSRPREPSLPGQCERSDHRESTDTRQLIEVKPYRARLVLRWVTTLESRVALSFLFAIFAIFFCPPAPCAPPGPSSLHAKRSRKSGRHSK